jgi:hypothetical protein
MIMVVAPHKKQPVRARAADADSDVEAAQPATTEV